jgi:RNA polymerase sigma factor (sigma-70 family)
LPNIEDDIQALVDGCKKNDRKAQELFYKRFYAAMASLCIRYISNQQDAMQVLNDGFLKVFKSIQTYDAVKASLYTWIRKIMINTAIDFLRKRPILYTTDISAVCEETAIENSAVHKMDADKLLSLIKKLPKATQLVFNLYTVEGYNHREIAEILNISEGTSKWHLSDARKQLKQSITSLQKIK